MQIKLQSNDAIPLDAETLAEDQAIGKSWIYKGKVSKKKNL
jgi:hypothetical protein